MKNISCDIVILGGGPAGMMAGISASENNKNLEIILVEKNEVLGKKLMITGGGRCNITNAEFDNRKLANFYGKNGNYLLSPLSQFNSESTFKFFDNLNLPLTTEANSRAFPKSNSAVNVKEVLEKKLIENKVKIIKNNPVISFETTDNKISSVKTKDFVIKANKFILTTGGKSRPETGSTGDGFGWLKEMGHNIIEPKTALVPIKIKDEWVKSLQGLSLENIRVSVLKDNIHQYSNTGKVLFTHFGLSGPLILNMSKDINDLFDYGDVELAIDFFPDKNHKDLDLELQNIWRSEQNKFFKNSLSKILPPKLVPIIVTMSEIDVDKFVNKVSKEERQRIIQFVKNMKMTVEGFLGLDKAIVSSGGVDLNEINFKTMQSKIIENLFLAGDILNFDRPSGGFSLQICWTTGFIAGESSAKL
jgi:predicted Rossmann fold flavoprotein